MYILVSFNFQAMSLMIDYLSNTAAQAYHIDFKQRRGGPFLLIASLSTKELWKSELNSWTSWNITVYHGTSKNREQS
jgi:SNF2 family DNA or RNA helicase